jgi:rod shape-determining protein MreC
MFDPGRPQLGRLDTAGGRGSREGVPGFVSRRSAFFVLIAALLAQLLFLSVQITRGKNVPLIQLWAVAAFSPFERAIHGGMKATAEGWTAFRTLWNAEEENQVLKSELSASEIRIQRLSEQAAENNRLRELLDLKTRLPYPTLAAEVVAAAPAESSFTVLIDRGEDAGLASDLPVITAGGVVGRTVAVYPHTAEVLLITDPSSGVGAMIETTRAEGIVRGAARNLCHLRYIMDDEKVSVGDTVVTSGMDQIYPKGFKVGTVVRVANGNIYKTIDIEPAAALDRLESVLVLWKPAPAAQKVPTGASP